MNEVSAMVNEMTRKIERVILHSLADTGQAKAATLMGLSESTVSRMKDGQIHAICQLISACGLKVVPAKYKCLDPIKAQAMVTLYEAALARISNPIELLWGED
jgi:hypothetical protein